MKKLLALFTLLTFSACLIGCDEAAIEPTTGETTAPAADGETGTAEEMLENAAEKTGEAIETAAEKTEQAVEKTAEEVKEAVGAEPKVEETPAEKAADAPVEKADDVSAEKAADAPKATETPAAVDDTVNDKDEEDQ